MFIRDPTPSTGDETRELKVKIPVRAHLTLHALKVLHGKAMSDAVTEALADYFEKLRGEGGRILPR